MADQAVQETKATVLLRCEELQAHLNATKERLAQAATQLEELTKILLPQNASSSEPPLRPWLQELAFSQLIADMSAVERQLAEMRAAAAEHGIQLPAGLK